MTDPTVPTPEEPDHVHADVELASAHLDDEVTSEERARLESDTELRAHVESLAPVVDRVRDVPAPPSGLVDAQIAAALAELDGAPGDENADVVRLPRGGARPRWGQLPLGAVAAALVVVALLGVVGLASLTSDDGEDTAADATAEEDASGDEFAESGEALLPEASTTFGADAADEGADGSAAPMTGRTEFASYDELVARLDEELAAADRADSSTTEDATTDDAAPDEESAGDDPCDAVSLLDLDPDEVETVLAAIVAGDPVTAVVHAADGGRRLVVVDDTTCQVVRDQVL